MAENNIENLWAIFYENDAYSITKDKVMGRQAAGNALLKAYAESDLNKVGVYARNENSFKDFVSNFSTLLPSGSQKNLSYIPWGNPKLLSDFGGLYHPAPDFAKFANSRFSSGHNKYSVVGVLRDSAGHALLRHA